MTSVLAVLAPGSFSAGLWEILLLQEPDTLFRACVYEQGLCGCGRALRALKPCPRMAERPPGCRRPRFATICLGHYRTGVSSETFKTGGETCLSLFLLEHTTKENVP
ncbi:hypothetical protein SKAU_G00289430 [Synaphobranchus kaupii]|uniref:Uncharacterized protein n=1 Tax=Synaphobranchus kaupii TaxID=118154 RepID=A0A9Q1ETI3_SYNKA|nr:hypothetical protein SKAU_G00289430 [Synaphobranchus kaupii]